MRSQTEIVPQRKPSLYNMSSERTIPTSEAMTALSPIQRPKTTAGEVEDRLILAIATGDKQPGERLTEAEISAVLRVSRVPVREAMQRLVTRGVLIEQGIRGLRVADFSPQRVNELLELRFAIERIMLLRVLAGDFDRGPLIADLNVILEEMKRLAGTGNAVALSNIDIKFHRAIVTHSGNQLAAQIWEGLAQHMLIVFCRHWSSARDRTGEVELHRRLLAFIVAADATGIDEVLRSHFSQPR